MNKAHRIKDNLIHFSKPSLYSTTPLIKKGIERARKDKLLNIDQEWQSTCGLVKVVQLL